MNCDQVMAVGSMTAGLLADALLSWGLPITRVRKAIQTAAFLIPAAALCVLANPGISPRAAVACLTVALGTTSLGKNTASFWDVTTDTDAWQGRVRYRTLQVS